MAGPLRILHVAGSAQWAGGEIFLKNMVDYIDRKQFHLGVLCPEQGPLIGEMRKRGVDCDVLPLTPLGNPWPIFKLRSHFARWKADIVQSHGARSNFYTRLAASRRWPHISTVHNSIDDYPVSPLRKKIYKAMDSYSAKKTSALVFVAEDLRKQFLARSPLLANKTHVIYNGIDLARYDPALVNRDAQLQKNKIPKLWTLGVVGRLTPQKGHIYLFEALSRARQSLPPFQLLIAGDGPLRGWLQGQAVEMGLRPYVKFLGVRQDVPEVLSMLDVALLPSVSEGLPYAVLEAMAMEKTVIASLVNGVSEIFQSGDEGYTVPPRSPDKIVETLQHVLKNPEEARRRAQAGRERVRRSFDLKKNLSEWQNFYLTLDWTRRKSA